MKKSFVLFAGAMVAALTGCVCENDECISFRAANDVSNLKGPAVYVRPFGTTRDGQEVKMYTLAGAGGVVMDVIDYGGAVVRLYTPDRDGKLTDITLGFNSVREYEDHDAYFGAIIGRYTNRIAGGKFTLDGKTYQLPLNNNPGGIPCSLHGGAKGFDRYVWNSQPFRRGDAVGLMLTMTSPDGDQGYPGNLSVTVKYLLTADNVWRIEYEAVTDKATPVNLTQHVFFNFKGEAQGNILDHELTIFGDRITVVDAGLVPNGVLADVKGSAFDFTTPHIIGDRINWLNDQLAFGGGYDQNYVLANQSGQMAQAAAVYEATTGRTMEVWTTEPALQFYCGNFLSDKIVGKQGRNLSHRGGLALETQHIPNSLNLPQFPSTILRPGSVYRTVTDYRFGSK
jgi:aldose 1-epimerase